MPFGDPLAIRREIYDIPYIIVQDKSYAGPLIVEKDSRLAVSSHRPNGEAVPCFEAFMVNPPDEKNGHRKR